MLGANRHTDTSRCLLRLQAAASGLWVDSIWWQFAVRATLMSDDAHLKGDHS